MSEGGEGIGPNEIHMGEFPTRITKAPEAPSDALDSVEKPTVEHPGPFAPSETDPQLAAIQNLFLDAIINDTQPKRIRKTT